MGIRHANGRPTTRRHPPGIPEKTLAATRRQISCLETRRLAKCRKKLFQRVVASSRRRVGRTDCEGSAQDGVQFVLWGGRAGESGVAEEGTVGVREME